MEIRKAELKDLEIVKNLNNELFELERKCYDEYLSESWTFEGGGKESFENAIKNDYVIIAEVDGKPAGYLHGIIVNHPYYDFEIAEISDLCVGEDYRGFGVGSKLCKSFEEYYRQKGITHFQMTASYKNESARAFYRKMGYKEHNVTLVKF